MIAFDFEWSAPLQWILLLLLFMLGGIQIWFLSRSAGDRSGHRTGIKIVLNLLLWLLMLAFTLQPVIRTNVKSGHILIAGNEVPAGEISKIKDSLKIREVYRESNFKGNHFDSLTLVGQDFSPDFLARISMTLPPHARVRQIAYFPDNQIQSVSWKGILRKGQLQKITGAVRLDKPQWIRVKFGDQTLDSAYLEKGRQVFRLSFPVFTERRTKAALLIGNKNQGEIRYFAQPLPPLSFQFLLNNPDFESRMLAEWLASHGHPVQMITDLSKDIRSKLTINKMKDPDIVVTDPTNAGSEKVKKAFAEGKSILFINLSDPAAEVAFINSSLGTKLMVKRISNEESVPLTTELSRLPFEFSKSVGYIHLPDYPVAVEKAAGKVAVSLMHETFSVMLAGDSLTYEKVWTSILAGIHPAYKTNIEVSAPVYKGIQASLQINNLADKPRWLAFGNDTLYLKYSPVNNLTAEAQFTPTQSSWQMISEAIEIPVHDSLNFYPVYQNKRMQEFIKSRLTMQSNITGSIKIVNPENQPKNESKVPDWIWFMAMVLCFTALWLEPKFN